MEVLRYTPERKAEWNAFVEKSKNGTFLFDRNFMDYHADRFEDCSVMVEHKGKVIALMPANINRERKQVVSHGGLTYGGLIMDWRIGASQVLEVLRNILTYYHNELGAETLIYKSIPHIYSKFPAEEDLYALFRCGAQLISRGVSSTIPLNERVAFTESRKSNLRKAERAKLSVRESDDVEEFWSILNNTLLDCHNATPVHSADEIRMLMQRFPERIRLFATYSTEGNMMAGALVFDTGKVVHTQYLASSYEGKKVGALDILLHQLINDTFADRTYFDFGISTENGGQTLNEGLIFQKEGFGGRAVCYDTYIVKVLNIFG